ncbi:MAG TPA: glycerol-3-phosphate 1-O-acyltransferase PlsY [Pseudomonadales bacterium]|nr:glycerol-3-phosphate 1-O-acyltransferase PlsY [Pseudomonadales bacterium]
MDITQILVGLVLTLAAYLMGSISTAILVCRALGYPDPRGEGSGNPGTTNVLRIAGKGPAALTLLGDVAKGVVPVVLSRHFNAADWILAAVTLGAFAGHLFPIFFKFEGGKGVATALGAVTVLSWPIGVSVMATWLVIALITRYSSLAAIVGWALAPVYAYFFAPNYLMMLLVLSAMLIYRHQENIRKLLSGTERKIGEKKPTSQPH